MRKKAAQSVYNSKPKINMISNSLSSGTIIDFQQLHNQTIIGTIKNRFTNNINLRKTELVFPDFKRKQFPEFAKNQYQQLEQAYRKKRKMDLMKLLSMPLYDMFRQNIKNGVQLPFELYQDIEDVEVAQSRIYKNESLGEGKEFIWHQVTCKFRYGSEAGVFIASYFRLLRNIMFTKEGNVT